MLHFCYLSDVCSLALDQGFFGPGNVLFFFIASGILEGLSREEIRMKLSDRAWQTITHAWTLWVGHSSCLY